MTREEAIDVLKRNYPSDCFEELCEAVEIAIQALSAQPEQRWVPVTERLPENDDWQIITVLDECGDTYSDFGWYLKAAKCWTIYAEQIANVIAWMPLPKPYRGEKNENRR